MGSATVFIWQQKDWQVRKGYVFSLAKTNRIAKKLAESKEVEWVVSFDVSGWNLSFSDISNLKESEIPN